MQLPLSLHPMWRTLLVVVIGAAALAGCSEQLVEQKTPLGGSCLACHEGITDVHPNFALACVDCHGGNDKVKFADKVINIRDSDLMKQSHVLPRDASLWWPNGIDDNGDGRIDEPGEYFDGRVIDENGDVESKGRVAKRDQLDSEMNRDVNYLRFINPGDLRVAEVSCGSRNRNANPAMVCHAEIVYDVRRSIMAEHSAVPAGAEYGNAQLPIASLFGDKFASSGAGIRFDQRNPRIGRVGYSFNYDALDNSFDENLNAFDHDTLLDVALEDTADPEDNLFEASAGALFDDGTAVDKFGNKLDPGPGLTRTGKKLEFFEKNTDDPNFANNRAIEVLQFIPNAAQRTFPPRGSALELRVQKIVEAAGIPRQSPIQNLLGGLAAGPITNPVDAALRNFRAYHSLNWWAPMDNFGFVDFFTPPNEGDDPPASVTDVELRNNNNPFGRMRPSGCSSCHVEYQNDGKNLEPIDRTVADNNHQPSTDLPFGLRTDLGQRGYAKRHFLKTAVELETCASCHGFVTRVDYAVEGKFEIETDFTNLEKIITMGPVRYTTPKGSCVQLFDNLAHYKNGKILNEGEGVTEDKNNNGELDADEDANGNACLDIPDRVARSKAFDGRQSRLVYGGGNGSVLLKDIHVERGFACTDCHYLWDVHGDSNIYTRNWDAVAVECDDCHGTPYAKAKLKTTGPNGGDELTDPKFNTPFGKPWFERKDGQLIQHSRTQAELAWVVPELDKELEDPKLAYGAYAHRQPLETFDPALDRAEEAREFAHVQEAGKKGGLECYSCHSSWQPNCLTCHLKMDVAKAKQEIWFGDDDLEDVFFQLFSFTRSPFYLGRAGDVEGNKIAPHRSTMQVHLTIVAGGINVVDNAMVSTKENLSSQVSNPYFPHTVRTVETKGCARCHTLQDEQNRVANDSWVAEATGVGSGRYNNVGDWAIVSTTSGFRQIDLKKEAAETIPGVAGVTFPGFDFDDKAPRSVLFGAGNTTDAFLQRGVSFQNGSSDITDVVVAATANGISIVDIFGRDVPTYPPTEIVKIDSLGPVVSVDVVDAAASQTKRFIALSQEELAVFDYTQSLEFNTVTPVIDPDGGVPIDFGADPDAKAQGTVLVAVGGGTCQLPDDDRLNDQNQACSLAHGKDAPTRVRLHGRFALLAHAGGVTVYELDNGNSNVEIDLGAPLGEVATFESSHPVVDIASNGRFIFAATGEGGIEVFDAGPVFYPGLSENGVPVLLNTQPIGTALTNLEQEADSRGLAIWGTRLVVADGKNGVRVLDASTPADLVLERTIRDVPGQAAINQASAVTMTAVPARDFAIIADGTNGIRAINMTPAIDQRTKLAEAADPNNRVRTRGFRLSMERNDPLTPADPKNANTKVFTYPVGAGESAVSLARGLSLDSLADMSGRRLRDGWSIGATTLDERTMTRMRSVVVKEVPGTVDIRGDGLGCVVRKGDEASVQLDGDACLPVVPGAE